ncbi:O-antigen ligase family protein [Kordiimonas sp. SCSIO 12603]|uniref:O-antigen ligase family protein n=1 Tax=Kordiimonas sp. SCSIO 12603 TaxID=2829596 RepID=UPI0021044662|nr:O-antigen ligase family protein [Kordiimonas sp. SCSIO 12603]UTW58947.1 O-antigen ligase family protein [Kordiimonas sp. SCSIO 12603]
MQKLIIALLFLAPALLASARPVWQWMWVTYVAIIVCIASGLNFFGKIQPNLMFFQRVPTIVWLGVAVFLTICFYQILAFTEPVIAKKAAFFSVQGVSYLLFFSIVLYVVKQRDDAKKLLGKILNIIFIYAAIGFALYVSGNEYVLWYKKVVYTKDLTSTFVNKNSFAAYTGMGLILSIMELTEVLSRFNKGDSIDRYYARDTINLFLTSGWKPIIKIVFLAVVLMLTSSRAGVVTSFLMAGLFILVTVIEAKRNTWKSKLLIVSIVIASVVGIFTLSGERLSNRLNSGIMTDGRAIAFPMVLEGIKDSPLVGHGAGSFEYIFQQYRTNSLNIYFDRAHNDYLELAFTVGIPATIALLMAFFAIAWRIKKAMRYTERYRAQLLAILCIMGQLALHSLVDFSLQMPAIAYTFIAIMAIGLVIAGVSLENGRKRVSQ